MKSVKVYALVAVVAAFGLTGCGNETVYECDKGDQLELDSDCGYWREGQFNWYSWVVKGQDSLSPKGFEPIADDETAPVQEDGVKSKSKRKTTNKPKLPTQAG